MSRGARSDGGDSRGHLTCHGGTEESGWLCLQASGRGVMGKARAPQDLFILSGSLTHSTYIRGKHRPLVGGWKGALSPEWRQREPEDEEETHFDVIVVGVLTEQAGLVGPFCEAPSLALALQGDSPGLWV